jgi:hypothetical protein
MLDEVGDVPRDGHVAGHGKFRAGEEGFEMAEEEVVRTVPGASPAIRSGR